MWEGRFKSIPVDSERYLLKCQRYIEQNPVRAGLVARPGDYPWSSYRYNAEVWPSSLLRPHPIYLQMVGDDRRFIEAYRSFLQETADPLEVGVIRTGGTYEVRPQCVPGASPG